MEVSVKTKKCGCLTGCPKNCGCRKGNEPCGRLCKCGGACAHNPLRQEWKTEAEQSMCVLEWNHPVAHIPGTSSEDKDKKEWLKSIDPEWFGRGGEEVLCPQCGERRGKSRIGGRALPHAAHVMSLIDGAYYLVFVHAKCNTGQDARDQKPFNLKRKSIAIVICDWDHREIDCHHNYKGTNIHLSYQKEIKRLKELLDNVNAKINDLEARSVKDTAKIVNVSQDIIEEYQDWDDEEEKDDDESVHSPLKQNRTRQTK